MKPEPTHAVEILERRIPMGRPTFALKSRVTPKIEVRRTRPSRGTDAPPIASAKTLVEIADRGQEI
jgi:hypothetical protein